MSASSTIGCSVVTASYLPYARVLAESFAEHNPDARFVVLLIDAPLGLDGDEPFEVLSPEDVGVSEAELAVRGLMYTPTELACSLRPALLQYVLDDGAEAAILMDADSCVYGRLDHVSDLARGHGTVFTAHLRGPHPLPRDGESVELLQIGYGVLNGGFLAVGAEGVPFLRWLDERLARYCLNAPDRGLYCDQHWLDLALGIFPHTVLADAGVNVMCVNLESRDVEWGSEHPTVGGAPLRHFHFLLAFDPERPEHLCHPDFERRWLPYLVDRPGAHRLAKEYAERLLGHGATQARSRPWRYELLPGGMTVERHIRAAYRDGVLAAEADGVPMPPNPFQDDESETLVRWLVEPYGDPSRDRGLTRYRAAIRDLRGDLRARFPGVPGEDTQPFLEWLEDERDGEWMRTYTTADLLG